MNTRRLPILLTVLISVGLLNASALADDGSRTWQGKWNNRKFGTSGPLKCVAKPGENGTWDATFTGTFRGDPFTYNVSFQAKANGANHALQGTAVIRGGNYQWRGMTRGNQLLGKYTATNGYFGEFQLKEVVPK